MTREKEFDVIIVGGSYSGLAAGMALGRALRDVLIIDSGQPCNRQTPQSHNFLTQDGKKPSEITTIAREQVQQYDTVKFYNGVARSVAKTKTGFDVYAAKRKTFSAKKLIFATGIKDIMPDITGFAECWGKSVLHCPYCHGYEVRNRPTGILGNGDYAFEFSTLISNWTHDLTLLTNGASTLTAEQLAKIKGRNVKVIESEIKNVEHINGRLQQVNFTDGTSTLLHALYARTPFRQHCDIPAALGCELNDDGYIKVDPAQKTNIPGVFACGDSTTPMRTVANAVAMGTSAGMMVNKELISEVF